MLFESVQVSKHPVLRFIIKKISGFQTHLKFPAQDELLKYIPGLENAEIARKDAILTKENLLWQQKMNLEEKVLYQELADDMETWFKRGYATDSENRMSQVKLQNALIQCKINEIDLLLNDLQTKIRFVREE